MGSTRPDPEFTSATRRTFPDLDTLFDAGAHVTALLDHPGWDSLNKVLDAAIKDIDAELDGRLLDSRADYARAHGRRSGLRALGDAARAIVSEADKRLAEQQRKHEGVAEPAPIGAL